MIILEVVILLLFFVYMGAVFWIYHQIRILYLKYDAFKKGKRFLGVMVNFLPTIDNILGTLPIPLFEYKKEENEFKYLMDKRNKYVYLFWIIFMSGMVCAFIIAILK